MEPVPVTGRFGTGLDFRPAGPVRSDRLRPVPVPVVKNPDRFHLCSFLNECELYPYLCQKHTIQKNLLDYTWIIIINNSNGGIRFIIRYSCISAHSKQNEYQDIDN